MSCTMNAFAMLILLAPQVSAAACVQGSCLEVEDATSLVQVNKVAVAVETRPQVKKAKAAGDVQPEAKKAHWDDFDINIGTDPLLVNAADDQMVQDVDDAVHDDVKDHEMVADDVEDNIRADVVGASVLPSPVGHGSMEDNPTVVDWKAETATMPGTPGGSVVEAYDGAMARATDPATNPIVQQYERDVAHEDEAAAFDHEMADSIHADEDDTATTMHMAADSILDTQANTDEVQKAAIHTVEEARQRYEEAAIKKDQTEIAAAAGHAQGEVVAVEKAAQTISGMTNARVHAALKKTREEMRMARENEIADGITAADNVQAQMQADGRHYVKHLSKENEAARAHVLRDAGLVKTQIEGAEGIQNRITTQDAIHEAEALDRDTESDEQDIVDTVAEGAPAAMRE